MRTAQTIRMPGQIRESNAREVLRLIRDHQPISRLSLARKTKMSTATITRVVNDLLEQKVVEEVGAAYSTRGRKPVLLRVSPGGRIAFGTTVLHKKVNIGLVDLEGKLICKEQISIRSEQGPRAIFETIKEVADNLIISRNISASKILGYGFALPGFVRSGNGFVEATVSLGWEPANLKPMLEELFGRGKVYLDGLTETMAQAEYYFGSAELRTPGSSYVYFFADEGVGAALVVEGKLFRGHNYDVGDIGHIPMLSGGPICRCGNRGCLEAFVSKPAILARMSAIQRQLSEDEPWTDVSDEIFAKLIRGELREPQFQRLSEDIARELAWGMLMIIKCYDPQAIVVAGDVFKLGGDKLIERIRDNLNNWILHKHNREISIVMSQIDPSTVYAASALVYQNFFNPSLEPAAVSEEQG